jgi:hypothetical protein
VWLVIGYRVCLCACLCTPLTACCGTASILPGRERKKRREKGEGERLGGGSARLRLADDGDEAHYRHTPRDGFTLRDEELEAEGLRVWAPLRGAKEAEEEPRGPPTPLLLNNAMDGD